MAFLTATATATATPTSAATATSTAPKRPMLERLGDWVDRLSSAQAHVREIAALQAKSDAELARMGLAREDIPGHVMSARYYI